MSLPLGMSLHVCVCAFFLYGNIRVIKIYRVVLWTFKLNTSTISNFSSIFNTIFANAIFAKANSYRFCALFDLFINFCCHIHFGLMSVCVSLYVARSIYFRKHFIFYFHFSFCWSVVRLWNGKYTIWLCIFLDISWALSLLAYTYIQHECYAVCAILVGHTCATIYIFIVECWGL